MGVKRSERGLADHHRAFTLPWWGHRRPLSRERPALPYVSEGRAPLAAGQRMDFQGRQQGDQRGGSGSHPGKSGVPVAGGYGQKEGPDSGSLVIKVHGHPFDWLGQRAPGQQLLAPSTPIRVFGPDGRDSGAKETQMVGVSATGGSGTAAP